MMLGELVPALVTRLGPGLRHIMLLPAIASKSALLTLARKQVRANRLELALVLSAAEAVYVDRDGTEFVSEELPWGGIVLPGRLQPPWPLPRPPDLQRREVLLQQVIASQRNLGYVMGDPRKCGWEARAEEVEHLRGHQDNGVPRGLAQCADCGEYRGQCFDPNPRLAGLIVPVHCRCQNWNRCARCGGLLAQRRLMGNQWHAAECVVMHWPAFSALRHRCQPVVRSSVWSRLQQRWERWKARVEERLATIGEGLDLRVRTNETSANSLPQDSHSKPQVSVSSTRTL